jgi:hypothetical protein
LKEAASYKISVDRCQAVGLHTLVDLIHLGFTTRFLFLLDETFFVCRRLRIHRHSLNWVRMEAKTPLASTWPIGLQPPFFNVWKTTLVWSTVLQLVDGKMKSRCTPCVGDGDAYVEENAAEIVPGQSPFFFQCRLNPYVANSYIFVDSSRQRSASVGYKSSTSDPFWRQARSP